MNLVSLYTLFYFYFFNMWIGYHNNLSQLLILINVINPVNVMGRFKWLFLHSHLPNVDNLDRWRFVHELNLNINEEAVNKSGRRELSHLYYVCFPHDSEA